jgi:hypothetical protein
MDAGEQQQGPEFLESALAELAALGADRFDPARFRYIESMTRRSAQHSSAVARILLNKAAVALDAYRCAVEAERAPARLLVKQIASVNPAAAEQAQALFDAFEFKALKRLAAQRQLDPAGGALETLLQRLNGSDGHATDSPAGAAIGELLRSQEADAIRSVSTSAADAAALPADSPGELRAAGFFREARQQQHADRLVAREAEEAPEDSGPLNPQKLAIRSLLAMRDLSPAYLGRFVAYVDTLFWLEKAGETGKP